MFRLQLLKCLAIGLALGFITSPSDVIAQEAPQVLAPPAEKPVVSEPVGFIPLESATPWPQEFEKFAPPPAAPEPAPEKVIEDTNLVPTAAGGVSIAQAPKWYHLAYWFGPTPWDIGFELGINGTEGINEALSFRTGGHLKRETDFWKFDTTLVYNKNSANDVETQNNALLDVRIDRKLGESPWSLYFLNQELYDEFQAYDLRVSGNTGVGYQFIDWEHLDLVGRFGLGASREFGGPDDSTAFEALFGLEYDHELTKTQRLYAKADYFPEWEDFERYRVVTDVGWEIDLDKPGNMSLKFSVIDRYDSTPNGADPNEINYAVLLIWGI